MSNKNLIFLTLLFSLFHLFLTVQVPNCFKYLPNSENSSSFQCAQCERGYILTSTGSSCIKTDLKLSNCIQLSVLGECLKCECGYSLYLENNLCVLTPLGIVGCDTFKGDSTCIRSKEDFTLFQQSTESSYVEFSRGTHCEIWNVQQEKCVRCHSGFKFSSKNKCVRVPFNLINEYLSFYTEDGELQSRSIHLMPTKHGVYTQIPFCKSYYSEPGNDQLLCRYCELGRIVALKKTSCIKPPFEGCAKVSDYNPTICEECLEKDHFYLDFSNPLYPECLPRLKIDPTERCLQRFNDSPRCKVCAKGLISTFQGCSIESFLEDEEKINDLDASSLNICTQQEDYSQIKKGFCEYFSNNGTCISCITGMILDYQGNCLQQTDNNCFILGENGECLKCKSLMYYNNDDQKCIFLSNPEFCMSSSGTSDKCDMCVSLFYLENNICAPVGIDRCLTSPGNQKKCLMCENLYYLKTHTECERITEFDECYISDGVNNKCTTCLRGHSKTEQNICNPYVSFENGRCFSGLFYRISEKSLLCARYTFENIYFCYKMDPMKDQCLECLSGFILIDGTCKHFQYCQLSDGINHLCYQGSPSNSYVDELGIPQDNHNYGCLTNKILDFCRNCQFQDEYPDGIASRVKCYSLSEVDPEISRNCFQLIETDGKLSCQICKNLYYTDSNGICKPLSNPNCAASNTKTDNCLLCNKGYLLKTKLDNTNHTQTICELSKEFEIPFCQTIKDNHCLKCQSLYYLYSSLCLPISDPDCNESNGLIDTCEVCSNGLMISEEINFSHCSTDNCLIPDTKINKCLKCREGYAKIAFDEKKCQKQKISNCELEEFGQNNCKQCQAGYFKKKLIFGLFQFNVCAQIPIPNCLNMTTDERSCEQCADGYALFLNGECFQIENCLKQKKDNHKICLQCIESLFLKDGVCMAIDNCEEQQQSTCIRCSKGYWPTRKDQKNNFRQKEHYDFSKNTEIIDKCERIMNCEESNGISEQCIKCVIGFTLKSSICFQTDLNIQNCLKFNEQNQCVKCKQLYYVSQGICLQISEFSNCLKSNGISNECIQCSFKGFILDPQRKCLKNLNCVISNGKDTCILCEKYHILNLQRICEVITAQIENCEIYSNERFVLSPAVLNPKKIDEQFNRNGYFFGVHKRIEYLLNELEVHKINEYKADKIGEGCIQCSNSFIVHDFQECGHSNNQITFSEGKVDSSNCLLYDKDFGYCSVCKYQLLSKLDYDIKKTSCLMSKSKMKFINPGCAILSFENTCWQCFEGFYLDEQRNCKPRRIISKCMIFDSKKDECLQCRNGYKFMEIYDGWQDMKICMRLEPDEEVRNCREYYPNSNKCKSCRKRLKQNIVEFRLNEDANICEDVLHLMCREIDPVRNVCTQQYIAYCEEQTNSLSNSNGMFVSNCLRCQNGYYLQDQIKCIKHNLIVNCLYYSQTKSNTCEICENLYFLQDSLHCTQLSHINCRIGYPDRDYCQQCSGNLTIDSKTGACFESSIINCSKSLRMQLSEICEECRDNFQIIENGKKCVFQLLDENCKTRNLNNVCSTCKEGYLLNFEQICIPVKYSMCEISNCLEYDITSKAEDIKCRRCHDNFNLDNSFKCQPLDPDSNLQQIQEQSDKYLSNKKGNIEEEEEEDSQSLSIIVKILVWFVMAVSIFGVVFLLRRRWILQKIVITSFKKNQEGKLDEEEEEQKEQEDEEDVTVEKQNQLNARVIGFTYDSLSEQSM